MIHCRSWWKQDRKTSKCDCCHFTKLLDLTLASRHFQFEKKEKRAKRAFFGPFQRIFKAIFVGNARKQHCAKWLILGTNCNAPQCNIWFRYICPVSLHTWFHMVYFRANTFSETRWPTSIAHGPPTVCETNIASLSVQSKRRSQIAYIPKKENFCCRSYRRQTPRRRPAQLLWSWRISTPTWKTIPPSKSTTVLTQPPLQDHFRTLYIDQKKTTMCKNDAATLNWAANKSVGLNLPVSGNSFRPRNGAADRIYRYVAYRNDC